MSDFLAEIEALTRQRVQQQKAQVSRDRLLELSAAVGAAHPFSSALRKSSGLALIAELKQASPSAGVIRQEINIPARLSAYARGGASAISILTEERYFHGSPRLLQEARRLTSVPLLRKDFIIDPFQILESRSLGADAVLLIAALLAGSQLKDLLAETRQAGLEALVEIHDESELETAVTAGAQTIGINNRNLQSLQVDTSTAERLIPRLRTVPGVTIVVESGIQDPSQLGRLRRDGAHAVLVGEALMRDNDPESAVRTFVEGGRA